MRIGARRRLGFFLDPESQQELSAQLEPEDPLKFRDSKRYRDRLMQAQKKTGEKDALVSVTGTLLGQPIVVCAFEFGFMGGSMGSVVGERFRARRAIRCRKQHAAHFICRQWWRTHAGSPVLTVADGEDVGRAGEPRRQGVPYVSVLTDPTTGGVSASLAMLGDVNIGEPGALIGFAGPRVIEQTVRKRCPRVSSAASSCWIMARST